MKIVENSLRSSHMQKELAVRLLTPSDKAIDSSGARLPDALVGLWASLGYGYQKLYPLTDTESVRDFVFWWLHYGQNEHPGFRKEINRYLARALQAHSSDGGKPGSPLLELIYSKRDDLKILYPAGDDSHVSALLEWWHTFGFREYKLPYFGLSPSAVRSLHESDRYGDFGYGEQFTCAARHLYQHIGNWRLNYDLLDHAGAIALLKHIALEVVSSSDELRVIFNATAIDGLAELTEDFSNFESSSFKQYCFDFVHWGITTPAIDLDAWWLSDGRARCATFIAALQDEPAGVQGFLDRQLARNGVMVTALRPDGLDVKGEHRDIGFDVEAIGQWQRSIATTDAFGAFGYGEQFTCLTRELYEHVREWRRLFDIQTLAGAAALIRHVVLDLQNDGDDLQLVYTPTALDGLSELTAGFSDFATARFHQYCFDLWHWGQQEAELAPDAWWQNFGQEKFRRFVRALESLAAARTGRGTRLRAALATGTPRVSIVGYPHGAFGIGEDARLVGKAVQQAGIKTDTYMSARKIISASPEFEHYPPITQFQGSDVTIFCMPAFDTLALLHDFGPSPFQTGYRIGLWQWELQEFPSEALSALALVDEIWTISRHAAESFRRKTTKPVHVIPLPVHSDAIAPIELSSYGIPDDAFVFVFAFDGASFIARKNPLAIIEAFQRAFPPNDDSVRLIVKAMNTQNESIWRECQYRADTDSRIVIIDKVLPRAEANGLLQACDCIVSLHRAEGFGRVIAEALYLGKPVVTSRYSGTLDFTSDETAYLVDGCLVDIKPDDYPFWRGNKWFQPDIQLAASEMKKVRENQHERETRTAAGMQKIRADFSLESCARFIRTRLENIMVKGDRN
ncbi:glycosyltransferase family 4 protein [Burkholderia ubonensis]|uniref:glycosyltransferase family 4 protein n=1 Tax=Burkholderia ubonensis TaxID=101571 RepID=UPI0009B3CDA0|nr:glycosyltransferase family 4 protein [Burkholderia ubonensis]